MTHDTDAAQASDTFRIANASALLHLDPVAIASEASSSQMAHIINEVSYLRDVCAEFVREVQQEATHG